MSTSNDSLTVFRSHPCNQIVSRNRRDISIIDLGHSQMALLRPAGLPFICSNILSHGMQTVDERVGQTIPLLIRQLEQLLNDVIGEVIWH